jgi:hypothetical protein
MTLAADLLSDLSGVFFADRGEFDESITVGGVTMQAIVIDDFDSIDPRTPQVLVRASDVAALAVPTTAVVGGANYVVSGYQPDGAGGAILQLIP